MMRDSEGVGMGYFQRVMLSRAGWKDAGVEGVSIRRWLVCDNGGSAPPQTLRFAQSDRRVGGGDDAGLGCGWHGVWLY